MKKYTSWILLIAIPVVVVLGLLAALTSRRNLQDRNDQDQAPQTAAVVRGAEEFDQVALPVTGEDALQSVPEAGKWKRYEISFENTSWSGNPFDLEFTGVFTHVPSNRKVTQLGFYAGDNTWEIYFMPDELGEWTFVTSSPDADLNGKTGAFNCVDSELPGRLLADGNRWMFEENRRNVAPIILATGEWFKSTSADNGVADFIHWANDTTGASLIGTTFVFFTQSQDASPYMKGREGEAFNIEMWDRLNSHFDALRDQGMGFYLMFYSDDEDSPDEYGITAQSQQELRLFRYALARFSPYPIVLWDTGIDISEYRSDDWVDWFADWFQQNDPWSHLVSSRTGGGSGGKFPERGTYYSDGTAELPGHQEVVSNWMSRSVPTAYTDRWREDFRRGDFDADKIRRAAWEVGLIGGTAIYFSGNESDGDLNENYRLDLQAAPALGHRTNFFLKKIINLRRLTPHNELITSGEGVILAAAPGSEYVAYDVDGGTISIDLSGASEPLNVDWYNPRTGETISSGIVEGGSPLSFTSPGDLDWVLHLYNFSQDSRLFIPMIMNRQAD